MPLYWRALRNLRLWDLSTKKLSPETRRGNSPPRKLERSNQESTVGVLQLRWGMLTHIRGV